jgi:D-alanine-D-alanine ligase
MNRPKIRVAVLFGGPSPEHDVSVVTGLQALSALDPARYDAFPVYVAPDGAWRVGDVLRDRGAYMLDARALARTTRVSPDSGPALRPVPGPLLGRATPVPFDIALLAFHGGPGEAGGVTGLCDMLRIPYTGMSTLGCAVSMDKVAAKALFRGLDIPVLPEVVIPRPADGTYQIAAAALEQMLRGLPFPLCVKPVHMGSSIGAAKVTSLAELRACLPGIFAYDAHAMVEPFVENLVEYNVAVAAWGLSAIERPKGHAELLDFRSKYQAGGSKGKLGGAKTGPISQGMLAMTRDINPDMPEEMARSVRTWARSIFAALGGRGAPRIDFYANAETGDIWANEVNPYPGSLGYFLWEAAPESPKLFTELLCALIDEGLAAARNTALPRDPVPEAARLLPRHGA